MKYLFKRILFIMSAFLPLICLCAEERSEAEAESLMWKADMEDFSQQAYDRQVERLLSKIEAETGKGLRPAEKKRVGLKVYTRSGPGLATPMNLVRALIRILEKRGFSRSDIFIFDQSADKLRAVGYLPPLSQGGNLFESVPVYALDSGEFYDKVWFYESALPARTRTSDDLAVAGLTVKSEAENEDRYSFLPVPLLMDAVAWINLPVAVDSRVLGVSGALANVSLWNISNHWRFWANPASAPVAVAEIASVPEMEQSWYCTFLSLETYQYLGGPAFNSLYTKSENELWAGQNPVLLDYMIFSKINKRRDEIDMPLIVPRPIMFDYCEAIGLGAWDPEVSRIIKVDR